MAGKSKRHFIKSFHIKNFRGIIDSTEVKIPTETQWIFLTGENGFGKTSVLQALAVGLSGKNIKKGEETINLSKDAFLKIAISDKKYTGKSGKFGFQSIFCYGSSRLNLATEDKFASNPIYSLFDTNSYLINIGTHLASWYHKRNEFSEFESKFNSTKKALLQLLDITDIQVDKDDKVTYIDKDKEGNLYEAMPFENLASGYKNIISLAGDMIVRLFNVHTNISQVQHLEGIVIIDEFDLHLHPKWQRKLPALLSDIFPNVQFIVSTHSPIPLLGAPEKSAFLKVVRNKEEGIKIENLDYIEVRNLTPNTILTSPIFDFYDIIPEKNTSLGLLRTEDDYSEVVFNQILEQKVNNIAQKGNSRFAQLFKAENDEKNR